MNLTQMTELVAYRMGNVRGQDSAIQSEIAAAVDRLEAREFHPWFLLSEMNFYTTKIGEPRVPLPKGFIGEYEEGSLFIYDANGKQVTLCKKSLDQIVDMNQDAGMPVYYALTNTYFRLYPVSDVPYKIEMIFYRKSEFLKFEAGENPWYDDASELVVAETVWAMLSARRDQRADYWRQKSDQEFMRLQHRDIERREMNRDVTFGGY